MTSLGKFVGFDNVVEFNKNRQNDDNVVNNNKTSKMRENETKFLISLIKIKLNTIKMILN